MRDKVRRAAEQAAGMLVAPLVALYRLKLVGFDTLGTTLSMVPGFAGIFLRRAWYRATLEECGVGLSVQFGSVINTPLVHIGDHCFIGHFSRIGLATIGNDVMIGELSSVISGGGQYGFMRRDVPMRLQPGSHTRVVLGDDLWIGAKCVISSDVASHSIVGAGSVVNSRFEEWEILAGVPAEPIATRPARRPRRPKSGTAVAEPGAAAAEPGPADA